MKLKFKLLVFALGLGLLSAQAEQHSREEHRAYLKSQITALNITNKFGTITINDFGGDSMVVDVLITIDNANEKKANYLLEQIDINIRKSGSLLKVETIINDKFKTKRNFSIDYTINIPADRDLTVTNKFGNVIVNNLTANGTFDISYGNINTGALEAPDEKSIYLEIAYGKADIESVKRLQTELRYSKLFLGNTQSVNLNSKYSGINIEDIGELMLDSKYDDVDIEKISKITANSKYTNFDIEELRKSLIIDTQYGSVRIREVATDFEHVELTNSYGSIDIGLGNTNYLLHATCDYCDVKYPSEKFQGNREKKDHSLYLEGTIGTDTTKKVIIKSRYGEVKLID